MDPDKIQRNTLFPPAGDRLLMGWSLFPTRKYLPICFHLCPSVVKHVFLEGALPAPLSRDDSRITHHASGISVFCFPDFCFY